MKCARYGLIAILLSIVVLPLSAMAVPLDPPIAPIMQDGLLFLNFSAELFKNPPVGPGASPQNLSEIDVSGITVNGASGLGIGANFQAPQFGTAVTLVLGFDVMALNPHQPIHAVTLTVPFFSVKGGGSGVVASAGPVLVSVDGPGLGAEGIEGSLSATEVLASGMRRLHIDSVLIVVNESQAGIAAAGGFDVTFPQSVPEPSIMLLLVFGAGLVTAMAHRVRRA